MKVTQLLLLCKCKLKLHRNSRTRLQKDSQGPGRNLGRFPKRTRRLEKDQELEILMKDIFTLTIRFTMSRF